MAKDSHALETLYKMYFPKMLGLCIKIIKKDEDTAKDLVHDAFVLAISSLHHLNTPERFGEWLTTITRNVAMKYMERRGAVSLVSITDKDDDIADANASSDSAINQQGILDLVDKLPNGYGKVLRLYVMEGFSHKEIAEILGIEPHSSSSQLSRAKAMLRKMINHKSLVVGLLLIITIPLFFFILREKPLQMRSHKIAEDNKREKDINTNITPQPTENRVDMPESVNKKLVISNVDDEKQDTIQISDTSAVRISVPDDKQMAKQDCTERTNSTIPRLTFSDYELANENEEKKSNMWQMLAAGSIGPALTQKMYKLITTSNHGNIGSEAPTFPENVDTWEDYSRYLHMTGHEYTPEDTLALMEIAYHNQGDIIEQEQHDRPVTFGISLSKPLSERWSIETGLQYSILKSRSTMGNDNYYVGKEQKIHYLGIPIRLSYRLMDYKRLSAYGSAGLALNIPVYGKVHSKYIVADMPVYTAGWHITPPIQWSTNFSMGVQYRILPKVTLYVEPTLYWHIPNGSNIHTIWTAHPIMFSAPFGIRLTW